MRTYPGFEEDAERALAAFKWGGGAVRLVEPINDPVDRHLAWGHAEKDEWTVPFGPGSDDPDSRYNGAWVWRYGVASAGTGSSYRVLATKVHLDVASREGGPIIVTVLSPWQDAHPLAAEGYLDVSYVAEHLAGEQSRRHGGDLAALTHLITLVLGRGQS